MKLHRAARRLDESTLDLVTDADIPSYATDLRSALDAISQLKCRAIDAKQKTELEIEHHEDEMAKPAKLPQLPVLPSAVEELKQKIALHNVSSM